MTKWLWFSSGVTVGLTTLSLAMGSIPERVTDDTALYQGLSEIRAAKEKDLSFDGDIAKLASLERRYQEDLPSLARNKRIRRPMKRIQKRTYRYTGSKASSKKKLVRRYR